MTAIPPQPGSAGPEAPEEVVALLVVRRRSEGRDAHVAGVEVGDEPLDRTALARRVPALEHRAHGRPERAVADEAAAREAQLQEAPAALLEPRLLLLPAESQREVELVQPPHQAAPSAPVAGAIEFAIRSSIASSRSKSAPSAWR